MKIKYLKLLCWFITLNYFLKAPAFAQSPVNRIRPQPADSAHAHVLSFSASDIPLFGNGLMLKIVFTKDSPLYISVRADGGVLIFRDSLGRLPLRIEKRNFYSFHKWNETGPVRLFVSKSIPAHGFLRVTIKKENQVLDDLYICMPTDTQKVLSLRKK